MCGQVISATCLFRIAPVSLELLDRSHSNSFCYLCFLLAGVVLRFVNHLVFPNSPTAHTSRCSSVQLLGDLLYKISGLSGKMSTESEEDDNFGTEEARQTLLQLLGKERRDRVLAGLYMGRCVLMWFEVILCLRNAVY